VSAHRPPAAVDGARAVWARGFEGDLSSSDVGIDLEANFLADYLNDAIGGLAEIRSIRADDDST